MPLTDTDINPGQHNNRFHKTTFLLKLYQILLRVPLMRYVHV